MTPRGIKGLVRWVVRDSLVGEIMLDVLSWGVSAFTGQPSFERMHRRVDHRIDSWRRTATPFRKLFAEAQREAFQIVRRWIADEDWLPMAASHEAFLGEAGAFSLQAFRDWLGSDSQADISAARFAAGATADGVRRRLLEECREIERRLDQALQSRELSEQALSSLLDETLSLEAFPASHEAVSFVAPQESLFHHLMRFRRCNVLEQAFRVAMQTGLEEAPQVKTLHLFSQQHYVLQGIERLESVAQQMRLRLTRLERSAGRIVTEIDERMTAHVARMRSYLKDEPRDLDARQWVQQMALSSSPAELRELPLIRGSITHDNLKVGREENRRAQELYERAAAVHCGVNGGGRSDFSKAIRREMEQSASRLFQREPTAYGVIGVIERWAARQFEWGNYKEVGARLDGYLKRFESSAPGDLFMLASFALQESGDMNQRQRTGKLYQQAVERRSDLAKFPNRFRCKELLGRGSFGPVYLVENSIHVEYALKVLEPREANLVSPTFEREALNHARAAGLDPTGVIVKVVDYEHPPSMSPFLLLEHVRGRTLAELFAAAARKPAKREHLLDNDSLRVRLAIAFRLVRAIEHLHGQREPMVHRDLHANNVMVAFNGEVRIIDFGYSKVLSAGGSESVHTVSGQPSGHIDYAGREMLSGDDQRQNLPAVDIRPLARLTVLLLTGHPNQLDDVADARLEAVLQRASDYDRPEARHATAAEFRRDLVDAVGQEETVSDEEIRRWAARALPKYYRDPYECRAAHSAPREQRLIGVVRSIMDDGVRVVAGGVEYLAPPNEVSWTKPYAVARQTLQENDEIAIQVVSHAELELELELELDSEPGSELDSEPGSELDSEPGSERDLDRNRAAEAEGAAPDLERGPRRGGAASPRTRATSAASIRQARPNPWGQLPDRYAAGRQVEWSRVIDVDDSGLVLSVDDELDGLLVQVAAKDVGDAVFAGPFSPVHWFAIGDRVGGLTIVSVDHVAQSIRGSLRDSDALRRWQRELAEQKRWPGRVTGVRDERIAVSIAPEIGAPVATSPFQRVKEKLRVEAPHDALGRRVYLRASQDTKAWPALPLSIEAVADLTPHDHDPLLRATLLDVDSQWGAFAMIEVKSPRGAIVRGRIHRDDCAFPPTRDLRRVLAAGEQILVRPIRMRPCGQWDYCLPNLWCELPELWLPAADQLCRGRVVKVRGRQTTVELPGKIPAIVPRALLRAPRVREQKRGASDDSWCNRLNMTRFYRESQEVEGYLEPEGLERRELILCPRWGRDDPYQGEHLQRHYAPGAEVEGMITAFVSQGVYLLLEPAVEAFCPLKDHPALERFAPEEIGLLVGSVATATVDRIDTRRRCVRLSNFALRRGR